MSAQKGRLLGWFDGNQLSACLKFTESSYLNLDQATKERNAQKDRIF
jgi:hypothetical protein